MKPLWLPFILFCLLSSSLLFLALCFSFSLHAAHFVICRLKPITSFSFVLRSDIFMLLFTNQSSGSFVWLEQDVFEKTFGNNSRMIERQSASESALKIQISWKTIRNNHIYFHSFIYIRISLILFVLDINLSVYHLTWWINLLVLFNAIY